MVPVRHGNGKWREKIVPDGMPNLYKMVQPFHERYATEDGRREEAHTTLTPESLSALMKLIKEDWEVREDKEREQVEEVACFVLASYAGGLRGEEVP